MATQKLVMAFVTLLIGIILLGVVSTETSSASALALSQNETFDVSAFKNGANESGINTTHLGVTLTNGYASTDWQYDTCAVSVTLFALDNATAVVAGTDYNITDNGLIKLYDTQMWWTEAASNDTLVTYTYCQDGYIQQGWGRTVTNLVPGFFAIALLLISLGLFYSVAKDTGVI